MLSNSVFLRKKQFVVFFALSLILVLPTTVIFAAGPVSQDNSGSSSKVEVITGAEVSQPSVPTVFKGDLRDLPRAPEKVFGQEEIEIPKRTYPRGEQTIDLNYEPAQGFDPLLDLQNDFGEADENRDSSREEGQRAFTVPDLNFAGQDYTFVRPPDTVGEIGRDYYIQMVNDSSGSIFTIYDKDTGNIVVGATVLDTLASSGACTSGRGDPIALYDTIANRWLMSEFALSGNHLCVYISQSPDPVSGGWYSYDFTVPEFPDYPKYAVWPDAYYVSSNESSPAVYALDRSQMLSGGAATFQRFTAPDLAGFPFQALIPGDLDGAEVPPAGAPGIFMRHRDDEVHNVGSNNPSQDFLEIWEFDVDFVTPANSTFTGPFNIPVAEFDSDLCGLSSFFCFPQPGTATTLDPLREVIMWRLQYRNFGDHETLTGNFVTDVNGADHGGIRWFELRRQSFSNWGLFQEGTYSPDGDNRWMGSIAMDRGGNMALAYSVSSSTTFPSIRYAGRLDTNSLGFMTAETTIVNGTASQTASTRWGDYSSMNVDPIDDCTFWYTNEYVKPGGQWTTRIARFAHDSCFGPCCNTHGYPGCADPAIEAAVCAVDPFCCDVAWDSICVAEVTSVAGDSCDPCESHSDATGAYVPELPAAQREEVSDCVCEADPFCCDVRWDSLCASEVESLGCGICPDDCPIPPAPGNPFPADSALVVKLDPLLAWNCGVADDYEDGNLDEYTFLGGTHSVTLPAAHDGFYGLDSSGSGWIYRDDAGALVAQGETISFWVRLNAAEGRAYAGFGASAAGTYSAVLAPNTGEFLLMRNSGFGFVDIGSSPQTYNNQWYRIEVLWGSGGQIVAQLYDSDGTTLLNTASALDNTFTAGGIAFRAFDVSKFFDTVQICPSPAPAVAAISEALKSRYVYARDNQLIKAPVDEEDLVWDEDNQANVPATDTKEKKVVKRTEVPEGYTIQFGMLVEQETAVALPAPKQQASSLRNVSTQFINFDDQPEPTGFSSTTRLTDRYQNLGVIFEGPGGNDGGAILDEGSNFGVTGHSSPNFLAFNTGASLDDGGIAQGPETIHFNTPVSEVQINAGSGFYVGETLTMEAFDASSALVDSAIISLAADMRPVNVSGQGIVRVVISSTAAAFVLDDLTWAQWCPVVYDVFFGVGSPSTKICSDTLSTFCDPGTLTENTTYFWQVVAKGPGGEASGPSWSFTTGAPCEGDFNADGDVDGSDLAVFAADFGRTDCAGGPPCEGDFNIDGDVDGSDLAIFAADFGRTDCPVPLERCQPQVCGGYTFDCNPSNPNCICVKAAEGFGSCVPSRACPPAAECVTSADCPAGNVCAVETCCGFGICEPDNACVEAPAALLETPLNEGQTMSGG